jgi:preprotein translocase subunit SecG
MSGGSTFRTKRGLEKTLFQATIILVIVFIFVSFLSVEAQK